MLTENTLFGTIDKVALAIDRIRHFEAEAISMHPDGYWVAFSGGKDSVVIKDLFRRSGAKGTVHYNVTYIDPPELVQFIREHHPDVIRELPNTTMWKLIVKKMMPPTRMVRYCCEHLKERGGAGRMVVTGIRWGESVRRSKRRMTETCMRDKKKRYLHPIIEWSDSDVWEYIRAYNVPYCKLYDEGFKRLGCIGCPMAGKGRVKEFERWPRIEAAYRKAFKAAAAARVKARDEGWASKHPLIAHWNNGDDMFDWWMEEDRATDEEQEGQQTFMLE